MPATLGFIGLGVMGEPMCLNLHRKGQDLLSAFDIRPDVRDRVRSEGVDVVEDVRQLASDVDILFLSLPGGDHLHDVLFGRSAVASHLKPGSLVVDTSTSPVKLTRQIADTLSGQDIEFVDAPVARTRQAAIDGKLSIMVGGSRANYERLEPLLYMMASDVTHCGEVGCGQIAKILNNMVLFQTVMALSEASVIAEKSGMTTQVLYEVLGKGSADSFALRNHGMKSILPGTFPTSAFSTKYAEKDLKYALELAEDSGIELVGAKAVRSLFDRAVEQGYGDNYFPVITKLYAKP